VNPAADIATVDVGPEHRDPDHVGGLGLEGSIAARALVVAGRAPRVRPALIAVIAAIVVHELADEDRSPDRELPLLQSGLELLDPQGLLRHEAEEFAPVLDREPTTEAIAHRGASPAKATRLRTAEMAKQAHIWKRAVNIGRSPEGGP
jgi:hypothetical protein